MSQSTPEDQPSTAPQFTLLKQAIVQVSTKREKLEKLLTAIENEATFDSEDHAAIQCELLTMMETEKSLRDDLDRRQDIYEKELKGLLHVVSMRSNALTRVDSETDVFSEFPKLADIFAKKQALLTKKAAVIMGKLEKDLPSGNM